jgi:catechol 2,3-dioxygenase-like lactoylglutathione lyase family enzyme
VDASGLGAITLFSDDLEASKAFYTALGLRQIYIDDDSVAFDFHNVVINVLRDEAAHSLIAPALVAPASAGARMQLTIQTDDIDGVCRELERAGIALASGPIDRPWGMRTVTVHDPAGHVWEFAQELSP